MANIGLVRAAANTTTGNQDYRDANLDTTPNAAIFIVTYATTDGVAADDAVLCIGFTDGTSDAAEGISDEHGQASSDTTRNQSHSACVEFVDPAAGTAEGIATFVSWLADTGSGAGVRINWTTAPAVAHLVTVVLFVVDNADVGSFLPNATENLSTTVTPGFEADLVFMAQMGTGGPAINTSRAKIFYGAAHNDVSISNYGIAFFHLDNQATMVPQGAIYNNRCCGNPETAGYRIEVTAFDSTTFDATTRDASGASHDIIYLALDFGSRQSWLGSVSVSNSTGNQLFTDPGFQPEGVIIGICNAESYNAWKVDNQAGSFGFSAFTENNAFSNVVSTEDAAATSNTQSLSDDVCVNKPDDDGSADSVSTFVSMDANGWTWNVTTAPTTAKTMFGVAIEGDTGGRITKNTDIRPLGLRVGMSRMITRGTA